MRLLTLPEGVIGALQKGKLTYSHARVLLTLRDNARIWKYAQKAIEEKMSVAKLEDLVLGVSAPAEMCIRDSTYIDQHQCNRRSSGSPLRPPRFPPRRRSNPPSRRTLRDHPPPSCVLPGSERNPSPANRIRPNPPSGTSNHLAVALANSYPAVTYKSIVDWGT